MHRVLQLLMLFLLLGSSSGTFWLLSEASCADECEGDDDGGECPPICSTCACSARPSPQVAPPAAALILPSGLQSLVDFAEVDRAPMSPEPREILRVPIALLS